MQYGEIQGPLYSTPSLGPLSLSTRTFVIFDWQFTMNWNRIFLERLAGLSIIVTCCLMFGSSDRNHEDLSASIIHQIRLHYAMTSARIQFRYN